MRGYLPGDLFVFPAFVASICWFDVAADELVEALRAFGHILDIPIAILGVTVLAWGNSISDLLACRALAVQGHAKMAISGCYGEPIFNRFFGVAVAYFIITVPSFPNPVTDGAIYIDAPLLCAFGFQTLVRDSPKNIPPAAAARALSRCPLLRPSTPPLSADPGAAGDARGRLLGRFPDPVVARQEDDPTIHRVVHCIIWQPVLTANLPEDVMAFAGSFRSGADRHLCHLHRDDDPAHRVRAW